MNTFAECNRQCATNYNNEAKKVFLSTTTWNEIKIDEIDDDASDAILPAIYSGIEALEGKSDNDARPNAIEQPELRQ